MSSRETMILPSLIVMLAIVGFAIKMGGETEQMEVTKAESGADLAPCLEPSEFEKQLGITCIQRVVATLK